MSIENTHFGAKEIARMLRPCHSIFFIGIGGISMASLARLSRARGFSVGGSDRTLTALTESLEQDGIKVFCGHRPEQVREYDAVVYTVAIGDDNPEYAEATRCGKPLFSRADYLGYLMTEFRERIGISGMHGKSTCTAMCTEILLAADPTVMCGAQLPALGDQPCRIGVARDHFLFEACEYMDSFLDFNPTLAVILNVGMDHVDYFHSIEQIRSSFLHFAERTQLEGGVGRVLYNADDAQTLASVKPFEGEKIGFGIERAAEFTAREIKEGAGSLSFAFCRNGEVLCSVSLRATGRHNVYNALAAASACTLCGFTPEEIVKGLANYRGAHRRMEYKGRLASGAVVYDDYGHHPDEIRATLAGARSMGYRRILCAYQPHTYSRTAGLLDEFATAFDEADRVYFADIYAAREQNVFGVTSQTLAERVGDKALYSGTLETLAQMLARDAEDGDLVIVMGAGDIYQVFNKLQLS